MGPLAFAGTTAGSGAPTKKRSPNDNLKPGNELDIGLPPPEYRNKDASDQGDHPHAHLDPVPDRRGIPMRNHLSTSL